MIYTITLNPSVDYTMYLPDFSEGRTNRAVDEACSIGGKGLNVSTVLARLSIKNTAIAFVAGFTGELIEKELDNDFIIPDLIRLDNGFTRINVKIKSQEESEINGSGPVISLSDSEKLFAKLDRLTSGDTLILAGNIPKTLPKYYYSLIIESVSKKDVRVVVDTEKQSLADTLKYRPFLIKPNKNELEDFFDVNISDIDTVIKLAFGLKQMGAQNVLVSLGGKGAVLIDSNEKVHKCEAVKGDVVSTTVGAGDSMIAGFIYGIDKYKDYEKALRMGVACGCACVFSQGLAEKDKIFDLYNSIMK